MKNYILGDIGENSSKQAHMMYIHTLKHDSVILTQPTQTGFGLSTSHRLLSLQHDYPCDLVNM